MTLCFDSDFFDASFFDVCTTGSLLTVPQFVVSKRMPKDEDDIILAAYYEYYYK